MNKKIKKYLDEIAKTEKKIADLQQYLRGVQAALKQEEDNEMIRCIRGMKTGALALGAVHVQRQADDDELGFDLLCHLADPGGNFVPGLDGDLRRDGRSQELGAVAGGEAGAAVAVIYC